MTNDPKWLRWAKKLQEVAQNGVTYNQEPYRESVFDIERYQQVRTIASEIMAEHADADPTYIANLFAQEIGHLTPKMDVRAAVFEDGKILLVKERSDGKWTLPGGWADVNESSAEAAERETFEESGYRVQAIKLIALLDKSKHLHPPQPHHTYKSFYLCTIQGGTATVNVEVDEIDFFAAADLPPLSLDRVLETQIQLCFEHYHHPDRPTDFD